MILTASKPVNVRLGSPSVNAPNPRFLSPGDSISIKSRSIGDVINGNNIWVLSDSNEFLSEEGFFITEEIKSIPFFAHLQNIPELFKTLDINQIWGFSKGEKINIGIIDSGVANHPSLKGKVKELNGSVSEDFDGHGTTMACIISALDETKSKIGISPLVENIFSYKIDVVKVQPKDLVIALDKLLKEKAHILNLSFSCNESSFFKPNKDAIELQNKINELVNNGCIIVCATGNNNKRNQDFYPAKYDNVISVAGFDTQDNLDVNSNLWSGISISMSTNHYFNDTQFKNSNGTSSATAIISGCIACVYHSLKGINKTKALNDIFSKLKLIKTEFGPEIFVPKFSTKDFLQLIQI